MSSRSLKHIFIMIVLLVTGLLLYYNWSVKNQAITRMYMYKINEFIATYIQTEIRAMTTDAFKNLSYNMNNEDINHLCQYPILAYDDPIALQYLKSDIKALTATLTACEKTFTGVDVEIRDVFLYDYKNGLNKNLFKKLVSQGLVQSNALNVSSAEFFSFKLTENFFEKKLKAKERNVECLLNKFDKLAGTHENLKCLRMQEEYKFQKKFNYELFVNQSGFYYLHCYQTLLKKSLVHQNVFSVLPQNMSKLIEMRRIFVAEELALRKRFNETGEKLIFEDVTEAKDEQQIINQNATKMSILIFGFDSLSKNHFKRVFPLTFDFLSNRLQNNIIYEQFSSVGQNTYPNLISMFTGIIEENIESLKIESEIGAYRKIDSTFHDILPQIWYEFEKLGYLTAFQEDKPSWGIYSYLKKGFRYDPTAFYGRPFWLKYDSIRSGPNICHDGVPMYQTYFNLIKQFIERMNESINKKTPYFSLNFLTEYTHDYLAIPPEIDLIFKRILENYETRGLLDNTLLMVFSDHGTRLTNFAYQTEQGKMEKYFPFLSVRFPKPLWNKSYMKNAFKNRLKLVTFYDLYQTFRQFLHLNSNFTKTLSRQQYKQNSKTTRYLRGVSLFEEIPTNRSCSDAFIPDKQCGCFKQTELNDERFENMTKSSLTDAANIILDAVNKLTDSVRSKCVRYKLDSVKSVKKLVVYEITYFRIVIVAQPGDAWFEANLKLSKDKKKPFEVHGSVIRISPYKDQAYCIDDFNLRNYCYCSH